MTIFDVYVEESRSKSFEIDVKRPIENPILMGTCLTGLISPQEIWDEIYNYISSTKEKAFIDSRTDIEKAESHGFDKKTSFRNM